MAPTYTVDLDSSAVTNIGAWTSKNVMYGQWRLCAVYVQLANGQRTSDDVNNDW